MYDETVLIWTEAFEAGRAAGIEEAAGLSENAYADHRDDSVALRKLPDEIRALNSSGKEG